MNKKFVTKSSNQFYFRNNPAPAKKRRKGKSPTRQHIQEAKLELLTTEVEAKKKFLEEMAATEKHQVELLEKLVNNALRE